MATAQGIATLLEAEKEAGKIVAKARQYRIQRLKDARQEAAKDIEALKQKKNLEFTTFESQFAGSSDVAFGKVNAETQERLEQGNVTYAQNKGVVVEKLMAAIVNIQPQVRLGLILDSSEC